MEKLAARAILRSGVYKLRAFRAPSLAGARAEALGAASGDSVE